MGEFRHNIDAKGRLIIPSKLREQCGESVVITRGFDGCLALYTQEGWNDYYQKLQTLPKTKERHVTLLELLLQEQVNVNFDKLGRVNIPNVLRIEGKLEKECIIVGVGDHVEIWNQNIWDDYYDANKDNFDEISESLEGFEL